MILRDPVHRLVSFEAPEYALIPKLLETREVQRLRRIRQLGLTSFAYPGADHTRFSHAIGAAYVMTRFLQRLQQLHEALPFWQRVSTDRARDAVAAALLHDLGHGPFSHLFEGALAEGASHETWSQRILNDPDSEVHQVLRQADPSLPRRVAQLIRGEHEFPYLANTVSGAFDVDRCDYLLRDAHFTGVGYGRFDLDWLLRSLRFGHSTSANSAPPLAIDGAKGLPAIESFILARLFMFQQVYFHKTSRASEWLLSRILGRMTELVQDGTRLAGLPPVLRNLALGSEVSATAYSSLDDGLLWQCISEWRSSSDPTLSDLCTRLFARRLFKTLRFYGPLTDPDMIRQVHDAARDLVQSRGLDPDTYVGVDRAALIPYDDSKESLRVIFPNGVSQAPADVSFLLGRLRGQRFERIRLMFPSEIRPELNAFVDRLHRDTPHPFGVRE